MRSRDGKLQTFGSSFCIVAVACFARERLSSCKNVFSPPNSPGWQGECVDVHWNQARLSQVTVYFSTVLQAKKETILVTLPKRHISRVNPFQKVNGKVHITSIAGKAFVNTATIKGDGRVPKAVFFHLAISCLQMTNCSSFLSPEGAGWQEIFTRKKSRN